MSLVIVNIDAEFRKPGEKGNAMKQELVRFGMMKTINDVEFKMISETIDVGNGPMKQTR